MAKKDKIQYVLNFAADLLSLCVSVLLSWLVTDKVLHVLLDYTQEDWGQFILILAFAFLVVFLGGNGASGLTRRSWRAELWLCVKNTLLLAAALAVALLLTKATMLESRYMYVGVLGLHFVGLFVTHTALKTYLNRYFYKANFATMVGIITTVDRAEPLLRDLKQDWAKKLQGVVLLDAPAPGGQVAGIPVAATYEGAMLFKRCIDILGALVGLVISVPIIAVTAIPLKLESPGPLFFKQKRVGLNGRVFSIYKLRSMYVDAEQRKQELMAKNKMQGLMFKMDDDPRITRVGRFIRRTSIDELPQFWNVLRGDMSLVGTRPPTLDEYEQYDSHHKRRLSMKPGITGLWQVSGRSDIQDFEEVVKLDVAYIDHWSLALDMRILFKTVGVVLRRTGAE